MSTFWGWDFRAFSIHIKARMRRSGQGQAVLQGVPFTRVQVFCVEVEFHKPHVAA